MKAFVFSDIHSNCFALERIRQMIEESLSQEDIVVFLGDLIGYYTFDYRMLEILERIGKRNRTYCILGNHDAGFLNLYDGRSYDVGQMTNIRENLRVDEQYCRRMCDFYHGFLTELEMDIGGAKACFSHGGQDDVLNSYWYPDLRFLQSHRLDESIRYFCGHTHHPFIYESECHVYNSGSAGMPRDRDPHGSYLVFEAGRASLHRFSFDFDRLYEFNAALPVKVKNRVYFGGNSKYIGEVLTCFTDREAQFLSDISPGAEIYDRLIFVNKCSIVRTDNKFIVFNRKTECCFDTMEETRRTVLDAL